MNRSGSHPDYKNRQKNFDAMIRSRDTPQGVGLVQGGAIISFKQVFYTDLL